MYDVQLVDNWGT